MKRILVCALMLLIGASSTSPCAAKIKSTKVPRFDAAVTKAVSFLKTQKEPSETELVLMAYALLKAGIEPTDPQVKHGIDSAAARAKNSQYQGYDHLYLAGVDAMLLADTYDDTYFPHLQNIANYVQAVQRSDGSYSDAANPGDVSMTQYAVLALWAAQRAGCKVSAATVDKSAAWLMKSGNSDGGWGYRPGTTKGPGGGSSTHNMTLAGAGTVAVARALLHGPKNFKKKEKAKAKFGILEKVETAEDKAASSGKAFPGYNAQVGASSLDNRVDRAFGWNQSRFAPVSKAEHKIYFYYALERAAALNDLGEGWFETYGDGLLSLQDKGGAFKTHSGELNGTSLAILYFMRSTQQIIDKSYGSGVLAGGRGLDGLFGKKKKKKELGSLDVLLGELENVDLSQLDDLNTDEIVESVQFGSKEELVGQVDKLKILLKSDKAEHRQAAYFGLGRTGDFSLIPQMLPGLRDSSIDVNVEALNALRYIARKPNGFGLPIDPLAGGRITSEEQKVLRANNWRTKAYKSWADWYRKVRPFEEGGGLDELELLSR